MKPFFLADDCESSQPKAIRWVARTGFGVLEGDNQRAFSDARSSIPPDGAGLGAALSKLGRMLIRKKPSQKSRCVKDPLGLLSASVSIEQRALVSTARFVTNNA